MSHSYSILGGDFIETIRVLMLGCNQVDDFESFEWWWYRCIELHEIEWMWANAASMLYGDELLHFRKRLVEQVVLFDLPVHGFEVVDVEPILELLVTIMEDKILTHYLGGDWALLPHALRSPSIDRKACDSERVGGAFLGLPRRLGLDVELCILRELQHIPGNLIQGPFVGDPDQRIVFEQHPIRGWTLRWE
jgi:hypothetical protein